MSEVYTRSGFVTDTAPEAVTLTEFLAAPGNFVSVILEPDSHLETLKPYLGQLAVITVKFPKYTDGRGYSLAARLRIHYKYEGTLRAVGDVLTDQIQYFFRQGFDELVITHAPTLARLKAGVAPAHSLFMQAAIQGKETAPTEGHAYSWRRSI
jgi:uncharacterized protein (DUF934 family)